MVTAQFAAIERSSIHPTFAVSPVIHPGSIGHMAGVLADSDPSDRSDLYAGLGLTITYHPEKRFVVAEARPGGLLSVSEGGLEPPRPFGH